MIDLGKAYREKCEAACDAFRRSLNEAFDKARESVTDAMQTCTAEIASADEEFMLAAESRLSGAGLAITNAVRQFVGEEPIDTTADEGGVAITDKASPLSSGRRIVVEGSFARSLKQERRRAIETSPENEPSATAAE